jgi:hypothetical protein
MSKNETHKEKMMRKKMERKHNRDRADAIKSMEMFPAKDKFITSRTPDTFSSVNEDPNRVVIDDYLKSQFCKEHVEWGFKEEFIGGFKTLRNDPFFSSIDMDGMEMNFKTLRQVESGCINESRVFHTQSDFTGIKHIALWSEEYGCFLAWKLIPNKLKEEPYGYSIDLGDVQR